MKKNAFTMIELIFVIVILGILAAVAVPKLSATRDDAKITKEMIGAAIALENLGAEFMAKGSFLDYTVTKANGGLSCFQFVLNNATDGNISLSVGGVSTTCSATVRTVVVNKASSKGLTNTDGAAKIYLLGGKTVVQ